MHNHRIVMIREEPTGRVMGTQVGVRARSVFFQLDVHQACYADILRTGYGMVPIYYCPWTDAVLYAPWWLAWLRPVLRGRDRLCRWWAIGLYRLHALEGNCKAPWPRWARLGWDE